MVVFVSNNKDYDDCQQLCQTKSWWGRGERGVGWRKENKGVPRLKSSAAIRCTLDNEQKRRQQVQHVVKDVKSKVVWSSAAPLDKNKRDAAYTLCSFFIRREWIRIREEKKKYLFSLYFCQSTDPFHCIHPFHTHTEIQIYLIIIKSAIISCFKWSLLWHNWLVSYSVRNIYRDDYENNPSDDIYWLNSIRYLDQYRHTRTVHTEVDFSSR